MVKLLIFRVSRKFKNDFLKNSQIFGLSNYRENTVLNGLFLNEEIQII